jgi:hypothetical protein
MPAPAVAWMEAMEGRIKEEKLKCTVMANVALWNVGFQ